MELDIKQNRKTEIAEMQLPESPLLDINVAKVLWTSYEYITR